MEVFHPPYLFRGQRPTITPASAQCTHGQTIQITSPQAESTKWASLTSSCVTTHSFDSNQRLVDLDIVSRSGGGVKATGPQNRSIAPPGWYMLFLVDNNGIPSVGAWIQLA